MILIEEVYKTHRGDLDRKERIFITAEAYIKFWEKNRDKCFHVVDIDKKNYEKLIEYDRQRKGKDKE